MPIDKPKRLGYNKIINMNWINCTDCKKETVEYEAGKCEDCYYVEKNKPLIEEYYNGSPVGVGKRKKYKNTGESLC